MRDDEALLRIEPVVVNQDIVAPCGTNLPLHFRKIYEVKSKITVLSTSGFEPWL